MEWRLSSLSSRRMVPLQGEPLPLGQGMDHLPLGVCPGDVEADGPLHAVQIVVEAGARRHEQGRGHPPQVQGAAQVHLKVVLDEFDGPLHLVDGQRGPIPFGNVYLAHTLPP